MSDFETVPVGTLEELRRIADERDEAIQYALECQEAIIKVKAERDALAAHLHRFDQEARRYATYTDYVRSEEFVLWHNDTPTTSLTRHDLIKQAEALEKEADELWAALRFASGDGKIDGRATVEALRKEAASLRRQAEENPHESNP